MTKRLSNKALVWLNTNWNQLREFFLMHKHFCEIVFQLFYIIGQVFVIILLLIWEEYFFVIIAIYTAILIGAMGIERTLMNARYIDLKDQTFRQSQISMELQNEIKSITKRNKELEVIYLKRYNKKK